MADVGKNIKKIRKEKNLTQDQLAERLHCTRQTISNYENGKSEPDIDLLIEIASILAVEVTDLIYGPKKKENRKKQKMTAVMILVAAVIMLIVITLLMPAAEQYSYRHFILAPVFLLRITFRPIALVLLGWGMVETIVELLEIPVNKAAYRKIIRFAYYVLLVCLLAAALIVLWMGIDFVWTWYMECRLIEVLGNFSSDDIPRLIPKLFERAAAAVLVFGKGIEMWCGPVLGAIFGVCRKIKSE